MPNKMGAMPPKIDVRDYKYQPAGVIQVEFPREFANWVPAVKNQGQVNSCVAHVAAELEEFFNYKERGTYEKLSPGYVYGCRYEYKGEGMYLRDALKTLKDKGVCELTELPYNKEVPEMINIFNQKEEYETDEPNKITTYFSIATNDVNKIKHSLMNCGPIMASVPWYEDFEVVEGIINCPSNFIAPFGYHAILIYGWNEKGWLMQNSWGTNWGNNGRAVYPYNYPLAETWGITDTDKNLPDIKTTKQNKFTRACSKTTNVMLNLFKKITKKF